MDPSVDPCAVAVAASAAIAAAGVAVAAPSATSLFCCPPMSLPPHFRYRIRNRLLADDIMWQRPSQPRNCLHGVGRGGEGREREGSGSRRRKSGRGRDSRRMTRGREGGRSEGSECGRGQLNNDTEARPITTQCVHNPRTTHNTHAVYPPAKQEGGAGGHESEETERKAESGAKEENGGAKGSEMRHKGERGTEGRMISPSFLPEAGEEGKEAMGDGEGGEEGGMKNKAGRWTDSSLAT